ncbi:MAG: HNH endonuclease [Deltaproteobacteria bacterium]|jgi:hypothetical protein|nr:HNH endonuclease [Deltaproteobacteria bacterium]
MIEKPRYSDEENNFLRDNYPFMPWQELVTTFGARFRPKTATALRKKCETVMGMSRATGAEQTINYRGNLQVIVKPDSANWKFKRNMVWEEVNGPLSKGALVLHLDGNTLNCDLDNLALSIGKRGTQKKLNAEIGPGQPELARAWVNIQNLEYMARVRKIELNRRKKED